jgi:D-amino peptidase
MGTAKAVYIQTDLEGVAGIDNWDPRHFEYAQEAKGVFERSEMQRLLTAEVNAAALGLQDAGVEEILINDSHGSGRTILVENLVSGVKLIKGSDRPEFTWLDRRFADGRRFDALVQVGMHAMSDTPSACLCHTESDTIKAYRINGKPVGEMELAAYLAGELGIPWVFTSGDLYACREAESWIPGMVSAAVKEGVSKFSAVHLAPVDASKLIRERIRLAMSKVGEIKPLLAKPPVVLEIERRQPGPVDLREGWERTDTFTIRRVGNSLWEIYE